MAFKTVVSLDAEKAVSLGGVNKKTGKANPTSVEGYYLGFRVVVNKRGDSKLHFLQTKSGNLGLWGKTDLDSKLSTIPRGTMVRASYKGMKPTKNGDMYTFNVEYDDELTIDVSSLALEAGTESVEAAETSAPFEEASDDSVTEESVDSDVDSEEDETAALQAAAEERKARVQAMLSSKKGTVAKTGTR